ncbi:MAG: response regulator [Anaerolineae bacterium]|nr:response regulator [Anaerolineae bacterium]
MSRIVVIEDNVNNARMVDKLLRHAGHDVSVEEEGESGLAKVIETTPDLVLVDLGLPDVDGQTIVAMIRQYPTLTRTRVIAFTAWPEDRAQEMAKAYGCDGVITKPIDTRLFAQQVAGYLNQPHLPAPTEPKQE